MASTQNLTKLPVVQYTGMDYSTVISEIQNIIANNPNWRENWTQFYSSEAGTLLVQLMAWICDNLAIRQDLLYNENYLSTATSDSAKFRLLKQIGYFLEGTNGASTNISIELQQPTAKEIYLSNHRTSENFSSIKNNILRFNAPDINGKNVIWEVLKVNEDGEIQYTEEINLLGNSTYYTTDKKGDSIVALQGETKYKEFSSGEAGGVTFNLGVTTCDTDSITVYDINGREADQVKKGSKHIKVKSFQELVTMSSNEKNNIEYQPCYILERNNDGFLQIRYPSKEIIDSSTIIANHSFKPGHTIGVFFRTSNGQDGNIVANYFSVKTTVKTTDGNSVDVIIKNTVSAKGGKSSETLDDATNNAPLDIRLNSRAVTIEDFDRVLQQNNLVLNSSSYSPDNEPTYFKNYYGRKIYPHEVFSFISSNKNFAEVPTDRLNYFPWIDTVKTHVLNEYYNFFECDINKQIGYSNSIFGAFIEKNIGDIDINSVSDRGHKINEYYNGEATGELLPNATIYRTSSVLGGSVNSELTSGEHIMKVKFHKNAFDGDYIKDINLGLFETEEDNIFTFTTSNNEILDDTSYSATFTSKGISEDEVIDIKNTSEFTVVIDDNAEIKINVFSEQDFNNEFETYKNAYNIDANSSDAYSYNIKISNDADFYDYFGNGNAPEIYPNNDDELLAFYNSKDMASYREGLVQRIQKEIKNYFEEEKQNIKDELKKQRALNKIAYVDLGLKMPKKFNSDQINKAGLASEELAKIAIQEPYVKIVENNNGNEIFYEDHFYRLKINDKIYAFRIDKTSIEKAAEFYKCFRTISNNGNVDVYDIFKSIDNDKFNFDETKFALLKQTMLESSSWVEIYNELFAEKQSELMQQNFDPDYIETKSAEYAKNEVNNRLDAYLAENFVEISDASYDILSRDAAYFENFTFDVGGKNTYIYLTADRLAALLNYLVSPYNTDKELVYVYDDSGYGSWKDIHDDKSNLETILDGNLRVLLVEKMHYNYNSSSTKNKFTDEDYYCETAIGANITSNYMPEYDIRFDYIKEDSNLTLSSVSEQEIQDKKITVNGVNYNGNPIEKRVETEDLFEELLGIRKNNVSYRKPKSFDNIDDFVSNIISVSMFNDGYYHIVLSSPKTGFQSSIYSYGSGLVSESVLFSGFGGNIKIVEIGESNVWRSEKSFGIRKLEMFVNNLDKPSYDIYNDNKFSTSFSYINNGDFIFVDNDANMINTPLDAYLSYKLNEKDVVPITNNNNFCYFGANKEEISYEDYCKAKNIEPMVSIEGGVSYYDEALEVNRINPYQSDWNIKLTRQPYNHTNSYYSINEDTFDTLNIIKSDNVSITTDKIKPILENVPGSNQFPLIFSIDAVSVNPDELNDIHDVECIVNNLDSLSAISLKNDILDCLTNKKEIIEASLKDDYSGHNIYNQRKYICRSAKDDSNRIVFTNMNKNGGKITFCYPGASQCQTYRIEDRHVKAFYKTLFGTNITNPEFYALYPKECFKDENCIKVEDSEYFYAPVIKDGQYLNLDFKYRAFEKPNALGKTNSRYADYCIDTVEEPIRDANGNFKYYTYKFYIKKTEESKFPDIGFYLHYVHDRSIIEEPNLEENVLQRYMQKYMIAGTDITILKPCFRTFDIVAKVYYNANFEEHNIKENVEGSLRSKYLINNISKIKIGNKVYLSDIINIITNVEGVEHAEITYFGFDATDQNQYPTQTKYLSNSADTDFYTVSILAEQSRTHGLQISYEKNEE